MEVRLKMGADIPQARGQPAKPEQQQPQAVQDAAAVKAVNPSKASKATEAAKPEEELDRETVVDVVKKAFEAADALAPQRHLQYELVTEADTIQVQVVNTRDGSIVRKVPADEIIEQIKRIQNLLSDRMDVTA